MLRISFKSEQFLKAKIRTEKPPIQDTIINFTDRFLKIYFYLSYVPN